MRTTVVIPSPVLRGTRDEGNSPWADDLKAARFSRMDLHRHSIIFWLREGSANILGCILDLMSSSLSKHMRDALLLIITLMVVISCASTVPFKQADLDSVLEDMERKAYLVRQFHAQFVKTRSAPAFDRELRVDGHLIFQKHAKMWLKLTGDINVEILSDGRFVRIIHDNIDEETFRVRGHRDMTKFADPLMLLIDSVANGGLRSLAVVKTVQNHDSRMVEIDPSNESRFERIKSVRLWLSQYGEIERVRILYKDGGTDDTVFKSWAVLSEDAPEIRKLNETLRTASIKPGLGIRGDSETQRHSLVREDPFPEPFVLRKPITGTDCDRPDDNGTLTLP